MEKSLPYVYGVRVIITLGYSRLLTNYKTIRAEVTMYPSTFRRSQRTYTEIHLYV